MWNEVQKQIQEVLSAFMGERVCSDTLQHLKLAIRNLYPGDQVDFSVKTDPYDPTSVIFYPPNMYTGMLFSGRTDLDRNLIYSGTKIECTKCGPSYTYEDSYGIYHLYNDEDDNICFTYQIKEPVQYIKFECTLEK
jgi:hypothetical protein